MVELCQFYGNVLDRELSFSLSEPYSGSLRPNSGSLRATDATVVEVGVLFSSVIV